MLHEINFSRFSKLNRDNVKSKFQLSVNDLKSTLSKLAHCKKLTFAYNLIEINVFAVAL